MRKYALFLALSICACGAQASPFVVSDPSTSKVPTECVYWLDGGARVSTPVVLDANGFPSCKIDVSGVTAGSHRIEAAFYGVDSGWGALESPRSGPLAFTRPSGLPAATGLQLVK